MCKERLSGLLEYLARMLAKNQDAIQVVAEESGDLLTLTLKVAEDDMGRVIGKEGKTAKAIRALMKAANNRRGKRVVVKIGD